jgi:predicted nucleic-acid-binding Zn-ribbon protein
MAEEERLKSINDALLKKCITYPCPLCGSGNFTSTDGFIPQAVRTEGGNPIEMSVLPTIVIICVNCGYVRQHELYYLGLKLKE